MLLNKNYKKLKENCKNIPKFIQLEIFFDKFYTNIFILHQIYNKIK